eukprot:363403-Chlamydomonas_euryale.AAC.6
MEHSEELGTYVNIVLIAPLIQVGWLCCVYRVACLSVGTEPLVSLDSMHMRPTVQTFPCMRTSGLPVLSELLVDRVASEAADRKAAAGFGVGCGRRRACQAAWVAGHGSACDSHCVGGAADSPRRRKGRVGRSAAQLRARTHAYAHVPMPQQLLHVQYRAPVSLLCGVPWALVRPCAVGIFGCGAPHMLLPPSWTA